MTIRLHRTIVLLVIFQITLFIIAQAKPKGQSKRDTNHAVFNSKTLIKSELYNDLSVRHGKA